MTARIVANNRQKQIEKRRKDDREYKASPRGLEAARKLYWRDPDKHREENRVYRNSEKGRAARKAYNKRIYADPDRRRILRDKRFRAKFGITLEEYDQMFAAQGGKCGICRRTQKRWLSIDHNHIDKGVRGLLCARCNFALGYLNDSPELADSAAAYLRRHAQLRLVV